MMRSAVRRRRRSAWSGLGGTLAAVGVASAVAVAAVAVAPSAAAGPVTSTHRPVALNASPSGNGYWIAAADGGVFGFGDARFLGSMGGRALNAPVVGMATTPGGAGYWLVASDGGVFAFGDAGFYGSMGGRSLSKPVVAMASSPSGRGYWLVASDGGVFAFGDAGFYGSMGAKALNGPIVGMTRSATGRGYRLAGADGAVFAFGDASFLGNLTEVKLAAPVTGMAARGNAYWMLAADGGVFSFGSGRYYGRVVYTAQQPGGTSMPSSGGYAMVLPRSSYPVSELSRPHHDYPAVDLRVPVGTAFYAVTAGTVTNTSDTDGKGRGGRCGWGVQLLGNDGAVYQYCHASVHDVVGNGSRVAAGARLGSTGGKQGAAGAGSASGPHLHLQVRANGALRCPQKLLKAIHDNTAVPRPDTLVTSGCTS